MFQRWLAIVLAVGVCICVPAMGQESGVSPRNTSARLGESLPEPESPRDIMLNLMLSIEEVVGVAPYGSKAILEHPESDLEQALNLLEDREAFLHSASNALRNIEAIRAAAAGGLQPWAAASNSTGADAGADSAPYSPSYPPDSGWYQYNIIGPLRLMGAGSGVEDRCGLFDSLPPPTGIEELAFDLEQAVELGEAYCMAAGCDPTGVIFCLEICGPVALLKTFTWLIKLPMEMCEFHDGKVDAAEIEAAYENSASLVRDLDALDGRVRGMRGRLETHDTEIKDEFTAIKAELAALQAQLGQQATMLDAVLANQAEIIELLNTPQGQRPDWNGN